MPRSIDTHLDDLIARTDIDAYFQYDVASNANHWYATEFEASDAFGFLYHPVESVLLVPPLEAPRARTEAAVEKVISTAEFVDGDIRDNRSAEAEVIVQFLQACDIQRLGVPRDFDLYYAEQLETAGVTVQAVEDVVIQARQRKTDDEIAALATAQEAAEEAMVRVREMIESSSVVEDRLVLDDRPLTSQRVRREMQRVLLDADCTLDDAIVVSGPAGADPHEYGTGPLRPNEPIIVDVFPHHRNGYWGDMTRTFYVGQPSATVEEMYELTEVAFGAALDILEQGAGVTGEAVHNAVCDVYETAGYPTVRQGDVDHGLLHSTGHAIGLELHEPPRLASESDELAAGTVLTVEPGLYHPEIGGVRIEDMIVVTEEGYRNLNTGRSGWIF